MVSRKTTKRKALNLLALFLIVSFIAFVVGVVVMSVNHEEPSEETPDNTTVIADDPESEETEEVAVLPDKINLQPVVDSWVASVGGSKGVYIYDLDRSEVAGEYNADESFATASLYKLFVVYEGYRRVENGTFEADAKVGWQGKDMLTCLDLAIRESYSPCAEPIWALIGHDELDKIVSKDWNITGANVSGLEATPRAIGEMMKRFYLHPDFKNETMISRMWDSFLNQPTTDYNWRQGLPSGFSDAAKVYNKVGWQWSQEDDGSNGHWVIYDDAAIIELPESNRHLIVVVMSSNIRYQSIRQFGSMIEEAIR